MARRKNIPEFRRIKAEIHKAKNKLRQQQKRLSAKAATSKALKDVKAKLKTLKAAYFRLGNIEPF